jgi:hypothetical protein
MADVDLGALEAWAKRGAIEYHDLAIGHEFHWACPWCHNGDAHQAATALIARVRELEKERDERKRPVGNPWQHPTQPVVQVTSAGLNVCPRCRYSYPFGNVHHCPSGTLQ